MAVEISPQPHLAHLYHTLVTMVTDWREVNQEVVDLMEDGQKDFHSADVSF